MRSSPVVGLAADRMAILGGDRRQSIIVDQKKHDRSILEELMHCRKSPLLD
jgi:hypothetical protein